MIQLYAHINDIIPTEPIDRVFDDGTMRDRMDKYRDSIKAGWKWSKRVNPDGTLSKGNATYYICKELDIDMIPVDIAWFTGFIRHNDQIWLRPDFSDEIDNFFFKRDIEDHNKDYNYDFTTVPPLTVPRLDIYKNTGSIDMPNIDG